MQKSILLQHQKSSVHQSYILYHKVLLNSYHLAILSDSNRYKKSKPIQSPKTNKISKYINNLSTYSNNKEDLQFSNCQQSSIDRKSQQSSLKESYLHDLIQDKDKQIPQTNFLKNNQLDSSEMMNLKKKPYHNEDFNIAQPILGNIDDFIDKKLETIKMRSQVRNKDKVQQTNIKGKSTLLPKIKRQESQEQSQNLLNKAKDNIHLSSITQKKQNELSISDKNQSQQDSLNQNQNKETKSKILSSKLFESQSNLSNSRQSQTLNNLQQSSENNPNKLQQSRQKNVEKRSEKEQQNDNLVLDQQCSQQQPLLQKNHQKTSIQSKPPILEQKKYHTPSLQNKPIKKQQNNNDSSSQSQSDYEQKVNSAQLNKSQNNSHTIKSNQQRPKIQTKVQPQHQSFYSIENNQSLYKKDNKISDKSVQIDTKKIEKILPQNISKNNVISPPISKAVIKTNKYADSDESWTESDQQDQNALKQTKPQQKIVDQTKREEPKNQSILQNQSINKESKKQKQQSQSQSSSYSDKGNNAVKIGQVKNKEKTQTQQNKVNQNASIIKTQMINKVVPNKIPTSQQEFSSSSEDFDAKINIKAVINKKPTDQLVAPVMNSEVKIQNNIKQVPRQVKQQKNTVSISAEQQKDIKKDQIQKIQRQINQKPQEEKIYKQKQNDQSLILAQSLIQQLTTTITNSLVPQLSASIISSIASTLKAQISQQIKAHNELLYYQLKDCLLEEINEKFQYMQTIIVDQIKQTQKQTQQQIVLLNQENHQKYVQNQVQCIQSTNNLHKQNLTSKELHQQVQSDIKKVKKFNQNKESVQFQQVNQDLQTILKTEISKQIKASIKTQVREVFKQEISPLIKDRIREGIHTEISQLMAINFTNQNKILVEKEQKKENQIDEDRFLTYREANKYLKGDLSDEKDPEYQIVLLQIQNNNQDQQKKSTTIRQQNKQIEGKNNVDNLLIQGKQHCDEISSQIKVNDTDNDKQQVMSPQNMNQSEQQLDYEQKKDEKQQNKQDLNNNQQQQQLTLPTEINNIAIDINQQQSQNSQLPQESHANNKEVKQQRQHESVHINNNQNDEQQHIVQDKQSVQSYELQDQDDQQQQQAQNQHHSSDQEQDLQKPSSDKGEEQQLQSSEENPHMGQNNDNSQNQSYTPEHSDGEVHFDDHYSWEDNHD